MLHGGLFSYTVFLSGSGYCMNSSEVDHFSMLATLKKTKGDTVQERSIIPGNLHISQDRKIIQNVVSGLYSCSAKL